MTRLSVNINDETAAALRDLAARRGSSVTEVVRRAVSAYDFLISAQGEGKQIRTVANRGDVMNVTIL